MWKTHMTPVGAADVFLTEGRQHGAGDYVAEEVGEYYRKPMDTAKLILNPSTARFGDRPSRTMASPVRLTGTRWLLEGYRTATVWVSTRSRCPKVVERLWSRRYFARHRQGPEAFPLHRRLKGLRLPPRAACRRESEEGVRGSSGGGVRRGALASARAARPGERDDREVGGGEGAGDYRGEGLKLGCAYQGTEVDVSGENRIGEHGHPVARVASLKGTESVRD